MDNNMDNNRIGGLCNLCGLTNLEHAGGKCPIQEDHKKLSVPPPLYAVMYPVLVAIARKYGYALAIHGTMTRDFDLVAVPWTTGAEDPFPMIDEMKNSIQAVYSNHEIDYLVKEGNLETKPHGRKAWSLHLTNKGCYGPYIDISVMPRTK